MSILIPLFTGCSGFANLIVWKLKGMTDVGGRKFVLLLVAMTVVILAVVWFTLKSVMLNYDVDRDTSQPAYTVELQSVQL